MASWFTIAMATPQAPPGSGIPDVVAIPPSRAPD